MSRSTALSEKFALRIPVIQAPMAGGGDTAEMVAGASNAGALGCIGAAYLTPDQIRERGQAVRARTRRAFGINLFAPLPVPATDEQIALRAIGKMRVYFEELALPAPGVPKAPAQTFEEQLSASIDSGASMFSFAFGELPPKAAEEIKRRGLFLIGTATTVKEAKALVEENGVDAVIAQGSEAGGHRSTFATDFTSGMVGTMALVPQVVDAVKVPVVASGGIMDGRGIAAALALGASAAQMGTAFLTCIESGISEAYKQALLNATEEQTRITRAFSGRPARGVMNRVLCEYEEDGSSILPFPLQNTLTRPLRTEASRQNRADYLSLWAGQGLRMARRGSVAELIDKLDAELRDALDTLAVSRSPARS